MNSVVFWGINALEALLRMTVSLGLFTRIYGEAKERTKAKKAALFVCLLLVFALQVYNAGLSFISTSAAMMQIILESGWLILRVKFKAGKALIWCYFCQWTFLLLKLPLLLASGLLQGSALREVNYRQNPLACTFSFLAVCTIVWLCRHYEGRIRQFIVTVLESGPWIFLSLGIIENFFTVYIMELVVTRFNSQVLIMNLVTVLCLFFILFVLFVIIRIRALEREKKLILSKERMLQTNYELLKQEQEKNRKLLHDHKYDFRYLYDCFAKEDYRDGIRYIENKKLENLQYTKNEVWTGCGCVDFLISDAKRKADEKSISFSADIDITEIPVAEYDLFAILGNLLDNALEAAAQCAKGSKFIRLRLNTVNDMLTIKLENSYEREPVIKFGRFVSTKENAGEHGWGIENIREIVKRHDGILQLDFSEHVFSAYLLIEA